MHRPRGAPPPTLLRTLAIVAVAVLLAIAVGGTVVSVWRGRSQAGDQLPTAAESASTASSARSPRRAGDLNNIVFSADSDRLSPDAVDQIREMAEAAKNATTAIVLSGKIEGTADRPARMALAKKRINAVSRALMAHGIAPGRLRVEVAEYPVGRLRPGEADVVEMNVR